MSADDYTLAVQAVGPAPAQDWPRLVRERIVQIAFERARVETFAQHVANTMDPNQKGWGMFEATITGAEIDQKRAQRCFITYSAWSSRAKGMVSETIRTEPTNSDPDAMEIARQARSLIGHRVRMLKRPDLQAPGDNVPKIVFHISDLGESDQKAQNTAPAERTGAQRPAPQTGEAPSPNRAPQHQATPQDTEQPASAVEDQPTIPAREAMRRLFNAVHEQYPHLNPDQAREASAAGMNSLGVTADAQLRLPQLDTAMEAARGWVQANAAPQNT